MNTDELKFFLEKDLVEYLGVAEESIIQNSHMNCAIDAERKSINNFLREFISSATPLHEGGWQTMNVLSTLSRHAKVFVNNKRDPWTDAAIVDFINFIAMKRYIDWGMCTRDLTSPARHLTLVGEPGT